MKAEGNSFPEFSLGWQKGKDLCLQRHQLFHSILTNGCEKKNTVGLITQISPWNVVQTAQLENVRHQLAQLSADSS